MALQEKTILRKVYIVQKWLTDLQALSSLSLEYRPQNFVLEYKKLMDKAHGN